MAIAMENVDFMTLASLVHRRPEYVYAAFRKQFALIAAENEPFPSNLAKVYYGRSGLLYIYTFL